MHYLLIYKTAADYLERRGEFREEHLRMAWDSSARGELIAGGAVGDPIDSAMLLFQGDSPAAAEAFAKSDPYVLHGVVTSWCVKPWHTVAGDLAATPVQP
ncbi:MAG: YciI-like protein [Fimbriimonadales bacterium]